MYANKKHIELYSIACVSTEKPRTSTRVGLHELCGLRTLAGRPDIPIPFITDSTVVTFRNERDSLLRRVVPVTQPSINDNQMTPCHISYYKKRNMDIV